MKKFELKEKILAVDQNMRELWDELDDYNRKILKQEFYILNRYISNVGVPKWGNQRAPTREEQEHFVTSVNDYYNLHWNTLQHHPKLLWMLLCMCSYKQTSFFHEWIGCKKKNLIENKKTKFLASLYPAMKMKDLEVLSTLTTNADIKALAKDHGMDDKDIAKILK